MNGLQHLAPHERRVILWLIGLNVLPELIFQLTELGVFGQAYWRLLSYAYGALWKGVVMGWHPLFFGQPLTMLLSYSFLHSGLPHLLSNMLALLILAPPTIKAVGLRGLLWLYGASIVGGAFCFLLLSDSDSPVIGASAAVYGLAAAWGYRNYLRARRVPKTRYKALLVLCGLAGLELINIWLLSSRIAWQAHLGGALAGILMSWAFKNITGARAT